MDIVKVMNAFETILGYGFSIYGFYLTLGDLVLYIIILTLLVVLLGALLR